jgi:hypothetical protein
VSTRLPVERIQVPRYDEQDLIALALLWYTDPWQQVQAASPLVWLWVVAQEACWSWEGNARGPLLIEAGRFHDRWPTRTRKKPGQWRYEPREATVPVILDSGAFSMIAKHGAWIWSAKDYVAFVRRACAVLGTVQFAATQDWMCEPDMLVRTGLSLEEHQRRTVRSYLELRDMAPEVPWLPALQGFTGDDYLRCADGYDRAGVDLAELDLVGLGSVCRRSGTADLVAVIGYILARLPEVKLHGYGVKSAGTLLSCLDLRSADSEAWSRRGRGIEVELRAAVGLLAKATRAELAAAMERMEATVDLDLLDMYRAKLEMDARAGAGLANSIAWAEVWRARQQCRIAAASVRRGLEVSMEREPGQLRLL